MQKVDARERREGARLEHEGAARGDGRRDLEDRLEQRVVPGRHERGDARRVRRDAARGVELVRGRRRRAPLPRGTVDHEARVVVEHVRAVGHVALGLRERLAAVARLVRRVHGRVLAQRGGGPLERVAPRRAVAEVRARVVAPRRRGDRAPRVVGGRVRELGEDRAVGWAVGFYRCVVACRRGGAVDVERGRRGEAAPRMPCLPCQKGGAALHLVFVCRHTAFELVFAADELWLVQRAPTMAESLIARARGALHSTQQNSSAWAAN